MPDASAKMVKCQELAAMSGDHREEIFRQCLCIVSPNAEPCVATRLASADQLSSPENATEPAPEPEPSDPPSDNLVNSDVFIYVIVFIVIVYFLTFLYLCMKKRQREAADLEAGGGGRQRGPRGADDRPPAYEDVMRGAEGGDKNSEPPTYAEVLARSQQLDKMETASTGS